MEKLERILAFQKVCDEIAKELAEAEVVVKSKRREHDKALDDLQNAVRETGELNLFNADTVVKVAPKVMEEVRAVVRQNKDESKPEADIVPGDNWREFTCSATLGLSAAQVENLKTHTTPILTLKDLSTFLAENGKLVDVPGFKKATAKKVEDELFKIIRTAEATPAA